MDPAQKIETFKPTRENRTFKKSKRVRTYKGPSEAEKEKAIELAKGVYNKQDSELTYT